jgi:predicted amidohydrolase YtcJ
MLIRGADVWQHGLGDVRIEGGRVVAIGSLSEQADEDVIDALGGCLLPGLHDHHIHLAALAVKGASVGCGPPEVVDEAGLAYALARPGEGWLRGIGYHESVVGMLDTALLDRLVPHRPVRIQHRSGRMWFLNSPALDALLSRSAPPPGLDRVTGRLFDEDHWLRATLGSVPPSFQAVSARLASIGVTGLTDMSPANDAATARHFCGEQHSGRLVQKAVLAGSLALADGEFDARLGLGPAKLHLHEAAFPDLDDTVEFAKAAHGQGRAVAVHCTTEAELVFALAVLEAAGAMRGDRIEHAGIAPDALVDEMARIGLHAVSQPHFIAERGDTYAADIEQRDLPALYRLRAFTDAGVTLAGGSDAPYGDADPWASMAAAVARRTRGGLVLGAEEALTPEQAVGLWLADPLDLTRQRGITPGAPADLCLLDRDWAAARTRLSAADVRLTLIDGRVVHDRIDQAPV